jgi:hypothetical protein
MITVFRIPCTLVVEVALRPRGINELTNQGARTRPARGTERLAVKANARNGTITQRSAIATRPLIAPIRMAMIPSRNGNS